jgi:hypothetical protein
MASGAATAFASEGMNVTLLEIGEGLPNIGYYFALDPGVYTAPTLDDSVVLSGAYGESMRYIYAARPDAMREWGAFSGEPAFPHMAISAFHLNRSTEPRSFLRTMQRCTARVTIRDSAVNEPDVTVLFDDEGMSPPVDFLGLLDEINPGMIRFLAVRSGREAPSCNVDEYIRVPADIHASLARRNPPSGVFFSDLASSVLQKLSYRRKRMIQDAAGK